LVRSPSLAVGMNARKNRAQLPTPLKRVGGDSGVSTFENAEFETNNDHFGEEDVMLPPSVIFEHDAPNKRDSGDGSLNFKVNEEEITNKDINIHRVSTLTKDSYRHPFM